MLSALAGPTSRPGHVQERADDDVWRWAQTQGTVEAYETYLRQFPLGKYTRDAYRCAVVLAARDQAPDIAIINPPACDIGPAAGPLIGTATGTVGDHSGSGPTTAAPGSDLGTSMY